MTFSSRAVVLIGCTALLVTTEVRAATSGTLEPISPWYLNGSASGCTMKRGFGNAERPLILEIRQFSPGHGFQLAISGDEVKPLLGDSLRIRYGDLPQLGPYRSQPGTSERAGQKPVPTIFTSSALSGESMMGKTASVSSETAQSVRSIALGGGARQLVLNTGSLGKPFASLRQCTEDLVASWGLDVAVQRALSRRVTPVGQLQWARAIQSVYPRDMAAQGKQGRVNLRMLVDANGKPTDCKILMSYSDPKFDSLACEKMMAVARFQPALTGEGKPVASYFTTTITWTIN